MDEYLDKTLLKEEIESNLDLTLNQIKIFIASCGIILSGEEIKEYLNNEFETNDKELKDRLENIEYEENSIDAISKRYEDKLKASKYEYIPYTLKHYKNLVEYYKIRCIKFLTLIEDILNTRNLSSLKEYDISCDSYGNLSYNDILRISEPFIYNFDKLKLFISKGNNLETYLDNKISLDYIYKNDYSEVNLEKAGELQYKNLSLAIINGEKGYIPLTDKQKEEKEHEEEKNIKDMCEIFNNMEDNTNILKRKI